jgi:hypothetical protein
MLHALHHPVIPKRSEESYYKCVNTINRRCFLRQQDRASAAGKEGVSEVKSVNQQVKNQKSLAPALHHDKHSVDKDF